MPRQKRQAAHLRSINADAKRPRTTEAAATYVASSTDGDSDDDGLDGDAVELVGDASRREQGRKRVRLFRERARGLGQQAASLRRWLVPDTPPPPAVRVEAVEVEVGRLVDNTCCCRHLLSAQPDFASECSALQHGVESRVSLERTFEPFTSTSNTVNSARHLCIFLPKFHCELNWIERYWGAAKAYARKHCLYTLTGLRETVPLALSQDLAEVPADGVPVASIYKQRRWARISRQYMCEYRKGANACDAIKLVALKRSSRHRDVNDRRAGRVEAAMASPALV